MQKMVQVEVAAYRGEDVQGVFVLTQDFTAYRGEGRRNGRQGEGFIKVQPAGEQLTRLAPNTKPVKLTVAAEGMGYTVFDEDCQEQAADAAETADALESGQPFGTPEAFTKTEDELYNEAVDLAQHNKAVDELEILKAQFQVAKGRERDALRKRIARRQAKLAAPAAVGVYEGHGCLDAAL